VINELKLGDHAAFFFRTNEERLRVVVPYMIEGLKRNERCVYIADENSVFDILCGLHKAGAPVSELQKKGALSVVTKRESYLRHGMFEPERMVSDLNTEVKYSLEHGFTGFRASGEMSWALDLPTALGRLLEYETKLQAHWPKEFGGVCQYDETRFPAYLVEKMIEIHSVVIRDGKVIRKPEGQPLQRRSGGMRQAESRL